MLRRLRGGRRNEADDDFDHQLWVQRWHCYYCKKSIVRVSEEVPLRPDQATRDHYVAQAKGGSTIVAACFRCNGLKGHLEADQFIRILKRLLENPYIDGAWHMHAEGLQRILYRMVRVEVWRELQEKKPNKYHQHRIDNEVDEIIRLIQKLKL